MSIRTSAKSIGNKDASTAELAATIRKAYAKATPEKKAELAREFKIGYIAGRERISLSDAEAIFVAGKGEKAIDPKAIDRATSGFNFHIVQSKAPKVEAAPKRMRLSAETREAAEAYLSWFDDVEAAIKALRAVAPKK
jgi:hypothetical protein